MKVTEKMKLESSPRIELHEAVLLGSEPSIFKKGSTFFEKNTKRYNHIIKTH